jgi:serine/threonine protein kinase
VVLSLKSINGYKLERLLGRGGMAEVYLAYATQGENAGRPVALKVIEPEYALDYEFRMRFEREAQIAGMLHHANIAEAYDCVEIEEELMLVLEYVPGVNLLQLMRSLASRNALLSVGAAAIILRGVCAGLQYAHAAKNPSTGKALGIIHRDISPDNVLLSWQGDVKIVDFGIAKAKDSLELTSAGLLSGKLGYMSPERAHGERYDHRTDVFSSAVILYELVTGRHPFSNSESDQMNENDTAWHVDPRELVPELSLSLEAVLAQGLMKDPSIRYQTAGEMQAGLEVFLNEYGFERAKLELSEALAEVARDSVEAAEAVTSQQNIDAQEAAIEAAEARAEADWEESSVNVSSDELEMIRSLYPRVEPNEDGVFALSLRRVANLAISIALVLLVGFGSRAWFIKRASQPEIAASVVRYPLTSARVWVAPPTARLERRMATNDDIMRRPLYRMVERRPALPVTGVVSSRRASRAGIAERVRSNDPVDRVALR